MSLTPIEYATERAAYWKVQAAHSRGRNRTFALSEAKYFSRRVPALKGVETKRLMTSKHTLLVGAKSVNNNLHYIDVKNLSRGERLDLIKRIRGRKGNIRVRLIYQEGKKSMSTTARRIGDFDMGSIEAWLDADYVYEGVGMNPGTMMYIAWEMS